MAKRLPVSRKSGVPVLPLMLGLGGALGVVLFAATRQRTVIERPPATSGEGKAKPVNPREPSVLDAISNAVRGLDGVYEVVDVRGAPAVERDLDMGRRFTFTSNTMEWTASKRHLATAGAMELVHLGEGRFKVGPFTVWGYSWEGQRLLMRCPPSDPVTLVLERR